MANILPADKKIQVIAALAEGSAIRSIERMTGIHRDTIMRLGIVEVFDLHGHDKANTAYAWLHATDDPARAKRHVTVLHIPPAVLPETAVRAAIVQEFRSLGPA